MKTTIFLTSLLLGSSLLFGVPEKSKPTLSTARTFKRTGPGDGPQGTISIIIDKSDYELSVYDSKGWFATYPVVFGNNSLDDKKMEGDKKTPEGSFRIVNKRVHDKWYRFLGIDYPTKESWDRFKERKKRGEIPASASIGGGVGIHGTWPNEDFIIDKYKNWTLGCISMKKDHVLELYAFTPIGTSVVIRK
ncbi:MAG: murein L,D-transpeptidase [Chitinophagaceae bacterium]|nr:MAG: murein L,D-transpeptidase [Chitinophagaceae bacterium]